MTKLLVLVSSVSHTVHTHLHKLFNVTVVLLYTGIDDLVMVKRFLKYFNNWQSLGLKLGLLYPRLERIEEEQHGDVNKCTMKMLAVWLQRQDNVSQVGVPSWSALQTALKNIGENELADTITIN